MIPMKSIPIYKRFANHLRSSGCRKIPCVSFGQQPSSLEYKLQNAWIERLARGWPKFSTTRKRSCGIYRGCGNERGLWRCPGRHEVLDRHCVVRWKKKKLSLYTDTFTCIQRNIPGEPLGYGTPIDDPIHPFHPSLQRVLPVWRAHPNRTSPKRSFHEPIRCVFGMRSFVSLAFLVSRARAPRMLKTGNKTEEWEYIW